MSILERNTCIFKQESMSHKKKNTLPFPNISQKLLSAQTLSTCGWISGCMDGLMAWHHRLIFSVVG